jgi:hypothetical protein
MIQTIKFEISLLPNKTKGMRFDKTQCFDELEDEIYYNMKDYLCSDYQAKYVLNHLTTMYMKYNVISNIKYLGNGVFSCDICIDDKMKSYEIFDHIENLLWKKFSNLSKIINLNGKIFNLNFNTYYEKHDSDEIDYDFDLYEL